MKAFITIFILFFLQLVNAQELPTKILMVFKNNQSLVYKEGTVNTVNSIYSSWKLPKALTETYWISSTSSEIKAVQVIQDSMEVNSKPTSFLNFLSSNLNIPIRLYVLVGDKIQPYEGLIEKVLFNERSIIFTGSNKQTITLKEADIIMTELASNKQASLQSKTAARKLNIEFSNDNKTQKLSSSYIVENIGWVPVYKLELTEKEKGILSLRAEIINDEEAIDTAEIYLAASELNITDSKSLSKLFENVFNRNLNNLNLNLNHHTDLNGYFKLPYDEIENLKKTNINTRYAAMSNLEIINNWRDEEDEENNSTISFSESQQQEVFYYKVKIINFSKNSRYQLPIFEQELPLERFYECTLNSNNKSSDGNFKVYNYVEFENKTKFPWTEGLVNIFAKPVSKKDKKNPEPDNLPTKHHADLEPLSQDKLSYVPVDKKCKILLAGAPDVSVTHSENNTDRSYKAKKFLGKQYDLVTFESEIVVVNNGTETIDLRLNRDISGTPLSTQLPWKIVKEEASLNVNPEVKLSWNLELKPKEDKKLNYSYQKYVKSK